MLLPGGWATGSEGDPSTPSRSYSSVRHALASRLSLTVSHSALEYVILPIGRLESLTQKLWLVLCLND
jgi:hypothetical protein